MKTDLHRIDELILARLRDCKIPDYPETQEITLEIEALEKRLHPGNSATNTAAASESHIEHDLEQHLAYCRALIAPLRRLPSELLLEIFYIIIASVRAPVYYISLRESTRVLMVLSQVCSSWRSVILSTPTLWKDINISSLSCNDGDARLVEMHLQYSASSPLRIEIYSSSNHISHMVNDILDGLILHCERWSTVSISGALAWEVLSSGFLRAQSLRFPILEALYIQRSDHSGFNPFSTADLPRLRTMVLHSFNPSSFPFRQLTSLTLMLDHWKNRAYQLPRDLAKHFSNLEHLQLIGDFDYLPNEAGGPDFEPVLPKLKTLMLDVAVTSDKPCLSIFLTTVRLPALLSMEIITPPQIWPQAEFMSLLACSQRLSSLNRLSLICQINDKELLETLRSMRSLEELKIIEQSMATLSPSLLRAMSISSTNNSTVILPKLQHVTFVMSVSEKDQPVGLEMVASRSKQALSDNLDSSTSCHPLQSFTLTLTLEYTPFEIPTSLAEEKLRVLRQSMDISVTVVSKPSTISCTPSDWTDSVVRVI